MKRALDLKKAKKWISAKYSVLSSLSLRFILNHQIQSHLAQLRPRHSFYGLISFNMRVNIKYIVQPGTDECQTTKLWSFENPIENPQGRLLQQNAGESES